MGCNVCRGVLIVNHYLAGSGGKGGSRHYDLARVLVKKAWTVTLVGARSVPMRAMFSPPKIEVLDGIRFVWIPVPKYEGNGFGRFVNMSWFGLRAAIVSRATAGVDPSVVVGSTVHPLAALAGLVLAKRWRKPFVFEVRDIWPQSLVDLGRLKPNGSATQILRWIEVRLLRNASAVVTLLPGSEQYLVDSGATPKSVVYIPNGVDFDVLRYSAQSNKPRDNFVLMYLGSHGEAHSLHHIVHAAAIIKSDCRFDGKQVEFHFYGEGPEKRRLVQLAEQERLTNVRFADGVPKAAVWEIGANADAFILSMPSAEVFKYGISPNKLFDYMAMGRPVIFCCNSKFNPIAQSGSGVTVEPEQPQALVEAVYELLAMSPDKRAELGKRALEYVRAGHEINVLGQRLEDVLCSVVSRSYD